jgi:hypothetical protein
LLARTAVRRRQLKPVFHFTISLARRRPALNQPTLKQHFHAVYFLYNTQLSSDFPFTTGALLRIDLRWTKLQFCRTPIHSGRTNSKPQFSLRRTISRMGRTMSVTDRYFKACDNHRACEANNCFSIFTQVFCVIWYCIYFNFAYFFISKLPQNG